ncbi:melanoma-associated antigen 10-like [Octodon degus]|uniref:Melanoma-associated antigen 10-like n=1 Tax=Octodon degus TaxID=10160 RepID=A0A6P6DHS0_OCTDE|nr:melanoma-associated antigen 10-like [Octodon degus]XP_023559587.1 melanoma-associated antigen 10-like [Octodon degus]XP_023559588.1 melanoma-associated antigen 10-like [Octodon degus]XP_023559589.1 melanoma-associated antigen 10-like [Octodon degus]
MMPYGQKGKPNKLGGSHPTQRNTQVPMGAQAPMDRVEEAVATTSSAPFLSYEEMGARPKQRLGLGTPSCPQNSRGTLSPPAARESSEMNQCIMSSSRQEVKDQRPSQDMTLPQMLRHVFLNDKLDKLVPFLLGKYQKSEQVTMEEMLHAIHHDYREQFPLIFRDFCECMRLGFGIDMREVYSPEHKYVLVPLLGLTYNGLLDDDYQSFPQISILIVILTIIFIKGNRASEEDIAQVLRMRKMLAQKDNIELGEPWKFITVDLIRERYLEYQQIPNSYPPRFEFLWGPRAYAETSKMKLLEHLARLHRRDPRSYPVLYAEALREEQDMASGPECAKWMRGAWRFPKAQE